MCTNRDDPGLNRIVTKKKIGVSKYGWQQRFFPIYHRRSMEQQIRWVRSVNKLYMQVMFGSGVPRGSLQPGSLWSKACERFSQNHDVHGSIIRNMLYIAASMQIIT